MNFAYERTIPQRVFMKAVSTLFTVVALMSLQACGATLIVNTDVPDSGDNRAAIDFVERYRHAIEERSATGVLALVSDRYFDDNGTLEGDDDMDRGALVAALSRWNTDVLDVRYEIRYRRVTYNADRVYVDFTYTGSFKLRTVDGDRWSRRLADNRVELIRVDNEYQIISGL